jgi:hypothetical protein
MRARRRIIASLTGNTVPARSRASTIFQVVSERVDISGSDPIAEGIHRAIEDMPVPDVPIQAGNFCRSGSVAAFNQRLERARRHTPVASRLNKTKPARDEIVCLFHPVIPF